MNHGTIDMWARKQQNIFTVIRLHWRNIAITIDFFYTDWYNVSKSYSQAGGMIMAWYEEAVFYHIYPIGMAGAPRENKGEEVVHRFEELDKWLPHIADLILLYLYLLRLSL